MAKRSRSKPRRAADSNTYRFFVPAEAIHGRNVSLNDATLIHQLTNVLRVEAGMTITLLDNSGWEYSVHITSVERHQISGSVEGRQIAHGEPQLKLTLYIALLRGERFEWVLQKGTELGISVFVPVICERSVVEDAADIGTAKIERWERIVREAAEQSRRGRRPKILPAQLFTPACSHAVRRAMTLLLWEGSGGIGLREHLRSTLPTLAEGAPLSLALFSGPEGGWAESEIQTAMMYNVALVTLGPRTLRADTAPVAATTAIMYEFGDLE